MIINHVLSAMIVFLGSGSSSARTTGGSYIFRQCTNTDLFFSVIAAVVFSLYLVGVAAAQSNTSLGPGAFQNNTTGIYNTASGVSALLHNTTGNYNTAIGYAADVSAGNLSNATAIGNGAIVNASDKMRLGNASVTVIEGVVAFTAVSDKTKKENLQSVDGEEVLGKIRGFELTSWNFIGHDPKKFRHYGPMA
ncbi:MAG TPA: tail fiber domain-containing protein [Candidatus Binatia bacterium]|nr:tail fiber domain-containing protein [Candidatus Binatia bacterium]